MRSHVHEIVSAFADLCRRKNEHRTILKHQIKAMHCMTEDQQTLEQQLEKIYELYSVAARKYFQTSPTIKN